LERYIRFIIRRRGFVLGLIGLITILLGFSLTRGVIATSMYVFLGEHPRYQEYLELVREFGNDESIIIAFEDDELLSRPSIERLRAAVKDIEGIPDVSRVQSILDAREIKREGGSLKVESYVDKTLENPDQSEEILKELKTDPFASGLLISRDGRHSSVLIEMTKDENRSAEVYPSLIESVLKIFENNGFERSRLHSTGLIAVISEVIAQTNFNLSRLFPIVCVVLLLTVFIMFRRLWPVAITALVAFIAVTWTMGIAVAVFQEINLLMAISPIFIMIISFSDVVHLCSSYLLELSRGEPKDRAIEKSASEVGVACFFTSLTTFTGFVSVALIPTPLSRQLGIVLGTGVALALLLAMTLTPIIFSLMNFPKPWRMGATSRVQDLLDKVLALTVRITRSYRWPVVAVFAGLIAAAITGMTRFGFEANFVNRFSEKSRIRIDERYFSEHFAGTNYISVYIKAHDEGALLDPEVFSKISDLQNKVLEIPEVDKVVSLVDIIKTTHRVLQPEKARDNPLPSERSTMGQYMFLLEMSTEDDIERMIDPDRETMLVPVHITEDGVIGTHRVGEKIEEAASEILGDDVQVYLTGLNYLLGDWWDEVVSGQRLGLALAFISIMVMMIVSLRSISWGIWSMVPNTIPLMALAGYLGWFYEKVDTDSIMVFMVAIGIAVDDTIHFLMRYRRELKGSGNIEEAVERTFHYSGRAIVMTSIIIVFGFAPFALSDYFTINIMGTLLPACLLVALCADLLLVPTFIRLGLFRLKRHY
jgi:predicted RND superfamily exporter protein